VEKEGKKEGKKRTNAGRKEERFSWKEEKKRTNAGRKRRKRAGSVVTRSSTNPRV
jgi:hypothetical protein